MYSVKTLLEQFLIYIYKIAEAEVWKIFEMELVCFKMFNQTWLVFVLFKLCWVKSIFSASFFSMNNCRHVQREGWEVNM